MRYLLDTTALSDLIRKHPNVEAHLRSLESADVVICTVVRGEVLYGIRKMPEGRRRDQLTEQAMSYLDAVRCEPVPVEAAIHYADLKIERERAGLVLDENDLWIAATALALNATLVTRDSDFRNIDGLKIEDWTA